MAAGDTKANTGDTSSEKEKDQTKRVDSKVADDAAAKLLKESKDQSVDAILRAQMGNKGLFDASDIKEDHLIHTGDDKTDFVANVANGAYRNVVDMVKTVGRSIKDPLSIVTDVSTLGSAVVAKPSIVADVAADYRDKLSFQKGSAEAGNLVGNILATVVTVAGGVKGSMHKAEARAVEGVGSIEQKIAATNRMISSVETVTRIESSAMSMGPVPNLLERSIQPGLASRLDGIAVSKVEAGLGTAAAKLETGAASLETTAAARLESGLAVPKLKAGMREPVLPSEPNLPGAGTIKEAPVKVTSPVKEPVRTAPETSSEIASPSKAGTAGQTAVERPVGTPKKAVVDEAPAAPKRATADETPAASKKAAADEAPAATKKAATDEAPAATKKAATDEAPAATKKAATDEAPAAPKKAATDEAPAATKKAATDEAPAAPKKAAADEAPTAPKKAATDEAGAPNKLVAEEPAAAPKRPAAEEPGSPHKLVEEPAAAPKSTAAEEPGAPNKAPEDPTLRRSEPHAEPKLTEDGPHPTRKDLKPDAEPKPVKTDLADDAKPRLHTEPETAPVKPLKENVEPLDVRTTTTNRPATPEITPEPRNVRPDVVRDPISPRTIERPIINEPLPKIDGGAVTPLDRLKLNQVSEHLDSLPVKTPGVTDAKTNLSNFKLEPTPDNYRKLADSLRTIERTSSPETAAVVKEKVEAALEVARQTTLLQSVNYTAQSIERLLQTSEAQIAALPATSEIRQKAIDMLQGLQSQARTLVTAEGAYAEIKAFNTLRGETQKLQQVLSEVKGAQSAIENSLKQVEHAQQSLLAANRLVRTGDTFTGSVKEILSQVGHGSINVIGGTILAGQLLSILHKNAEYAESKVKASTQEHDGQPNGTKLEKAELKTEEHKQASLYLNSKDPQRLRAEIENNPHEKIRKRNNMFGLTFDDFVYYQKAPGVVAQPEEVQQTYQQPLVRPFRSTVEQEKTAVQKFDWKKTRFNADGSSARADNPYLSSPITAFRPSTKQKGMGASSTDPNHANSLITKNYAFAVGPQQTSSTAPRGTAASSLEATERNSADRSANSVAASGSIASAPVLPTANDPSSTQALSE